MPTAIALDAAIALLKRYRLFLIVGPLLIALGLSHCSDKRHTRQRDAARAEIATMIEAQKQATAAALAARAKTEKLTKDLAHATDQHAADLDAISRRALADRMRAKAGYCPASGTTPAAVPDDPARDPGSDTGGVYFTAAEADLLRRHEVRSFACEGWGRSLIEAGVAIKE